MIELVQSLNYWLALGTIALQLAAAYLLIDYFFPRFRIGRRATVLVDRYALQLVFVVATAVAVLTLVYSEVFGFIPCGLCWMERVFLYPIPFAVGLAIVRRTAAGYISAVADIGMLLSVIGGVIALYHHYIQMGGAAFAACPTAGEGADCARRIIFEFGYVTFPLMAVSVFVFIFVVLLRARRAGV